MHYSSMNELDGMDHGFFIPSKDAQTLSFESLSCCNELLQKQSQVAVVQCWRGAQFWFNITTCFQFGATIEN
jgi:hypothetical protein